MANIKPREREAVIRSLMAGVVPRIGLHHIQVGRAQEVDAMLADLARVEDGGASVRFVVGRFGAGKSFFLNLTKAVALEKKFVVMQADVTPSRRLFSTSGHARALYTELTRNMSVRAKPDGGALPGVIERWISDFIDSSGRNPKEDDPSVFTDIKEKLAPLQDLVSGYDFAAVLCKYLAGYWNGNDALTASCLRWLSGEYATRAEARSDLEVRSIIDDRDIYSYLKLWGAFVRLAGYAGLLVELDEMGVLSHRLANAAARNSNYEIILQILNDCLQGSVSGVGFIFAGTDSFFDDGRRGVMSYGALAGRLGENPYAKDGMRDLSGPVMRLENLSPEDLWLLLHNIRHVFALGGVEKYLIPDEAISAFIKHCAQTLGAEFYQTPRDAVKAFTGFLSVLEQNPGADWRNLLGETAVEKSHDNTNPDDELSGFTMR